MTNRKNQDATTFCDKYYKIYEFLCRDYKKRTGIALAQYKKYEPEYLIKMYLRFTDENELVKQVSKMLSDPILIQALPNANHRTAFLFIRIYCEKQGIQMKSYDEATPDYERFIRISKTIIDTDIDHVNFFNELYIDTHHGIGLKRHLTAATQLIEKILVRPQSGIRTVESFQSFIAFLNHSGSLSFSNH